MPVTRVGVLAYEGCFGAELFGILDLLTVANQVLAVTAGVEPFAAAVLTARPGSVSTASATTIGPVMSTATATRRGLDLVVVPGFAYLPGLDLDRRLGGWSAEISFLRRSAARGVPVASICVGAFLLG
jgi:putative intracellular protease/amidase